MQKRVLTIAMALAMIAAMTLPMAVNAAETGTVTCTVSGELVSVTVTDGAVNYGTLELSQTKDTTDGGVNNHQIATNTGTVNEKFTIKSSNADGATDWTLGSTQAADQFIHEFSANSGTDWTAMDDEGVELASAVAAGGTKTFDLRIGMPTSVTDYTQHTIIVTITATLSGS
jgi:hypothetical protein